MFKIKQECPLSIKYSILDNSLGMETLHYTMADPQMVPVDLLDVILPEDIYRMSYPYPGGGGGGGGGGGAANWNHCNSVKICVFSN
jgi:hypothetical protein